MSEEDTLPGTGPAPGPKPQPVPNPIPPPVGTPAVEQKQPHSFDEQYEDFVRTGGLLL